MIYIKNYKKYYCNLILRVDTPRIILRDREMKLDWAKSGMD
jgi:hypothetical protein